jgi:uncharacterized membrane protein YeaQ/YmgE (transglycosylase-associated protein family)
MTVSQIFAWFVIGVVAGYIVAALTGRPRSGAAIFENLGVGLVGAVVGGFLFKFFGVLPSLDTVAISLRDVISAVLGSLLLLGGVAWWRRRAP